MEDYNFRGWATKNDLVCSDGRIIREGAFKHHDGQRVPLVWNHDHNDPYRVIGHVILEHRDEGVYAYGYFNNTDLGQTAQQYVEHGDITQMSICANQLKQQGPNVMHGCIREVSLVIAGANPGAFIENVIKHGEESSEEAIIFTGEDFEVYHGDGEEFTDPEAEVESPEGTKPELEHADEGSSGEKEEKPVSENEKTIKEIYDAMSDEQKDVVHALVGMALEDDDDEDENEVEHSEGGNLVMKSNVFDNATQQSANVLTHADQEAIIALAKSSGVGSLRAAMDIYAEEHADTLEHGWEAESLAQLFPDYKDVHAGAPELLERDQSWVGLVMRKAHKSPISRVRTRQADARANELRAKGYNDRKVAKTLSGDLKLIMRTTDPQTVYRRDELHRDDIIDITDFDVVAYQKVVMRHNLEEDIALAALIGDGREDTDPDKIHENHIRSIWNDEELYTIHADVNIEAARTELQGTNTSANFGENYIYAEAIISAALYAREKYKGKGTLDFFCTPHLLNVMLLARDLNGRRIYDSKADLAKALNVGEIHTVEQFEGKTRTTKEGDTKKLLGIFVNMANYQFGSTKGGEIANFEDFDIDFNKYKYLMETRLSGALTEVYSAIALEEPVTEAVAG
jgi:HK97 family phage prohead protease